MKEIWTTLASLMGVWAFLQTFLHTIFPPEFRFAAVKLLHRFSNYFSTYCYYDITEMDNGVNTNELYTAVQLYLSSNAASLSPTPTRLTLTRPLNSSTITYGLSNNDRLTDTFNNVTVQWEHVVTQRSSQTFSWRPVPDEKRGFTLRVGKKNKHLVLDSYLEYIIDRANELKRKSQERLLYTNSRGGSLDSRGHPWESVPFKHPSTFETLAMDPCKKREIMDDLKDFANGEGFYHRTGRAWKRGYLLYGPPGTGKSSMIAAMANYLGYDIYDLELTEVSTNSELRKLLMKTTSKSIIVIEDIDCSINLTNRNKGFNGGNSSGNGNNNNSGRRTSGGYDIRSPPGGNGGDDGNNGNTITLSGLLNFTDGLWSCCGSERIFVFTTNHVEKLDPALLRSGRMDMHVHMSYCTLPALKILFKNYLGYDEDDDLISELVMELENVIGDAEMTPADVSEVLIKNRRDRDKAVSELVEALKTKAEKSRAMKKKRGEMVEDDEEHEKRALDNIEEQGGNESSSSSSAAGGGGSELQQQSSCVGGKDENSIDGLDDGDHQEKVH